MQIDAVEIYHVAMPLVYPFRTAFGNDDTIESVLVKLVSGDHYGWGEASPWRYPAYSAEFAEGQFLVSKEFITRPLLGKDISSGRQLQDELSWIKGNFFAKAGFDLAWWDLYAKYWRLQRRGTFSVKSSNAFAEQTIDFVCGWFKLFCFG